MNATIRLYQSEDLAQVVAVLSAAMPADPVSPARFTRQVLLDANYRAEGALVALQGGAAVGFVLAVARQMPLENAPPDADRGYLTLLAVRPDRQRQGVGERLLAAAEAYLRAQQRRAVLVSPYAPGYFLPGVDVAAYEGALCFFLRHGYTEVYRPVAMETSLWERAVPEWASERLRRLDEAGVCREAYRAELTLPLLEFVRREFPGDWVRVVREAMARILEGEPADRLIVAHEAGSVRGFVHWERERFGPIGVAAGERGRGLGQALMVAALDAMRRHGYRSAWFLWSDDATARRLYDAAGFRERRRFAVLRKELTE